MPKANPYLNFVKAHATLLEEGRTLPLGGFESKQKANVDSSKPPVLIFSPHPDDECIIGGIALRLQNECGWPVVNIAVTQGSNRERQAARWTELQQACDYIGFKLVPTIPGGLMLVTAQSRNDNPAAWNQSVAVIRDILEANRPAVILFPHSTDWNGTHIGTHLLVTDALKQLSSDFHCYTLETEFWAAMQTPNLTVESSSSDVAELVAALSFHVGEVKRNPYHLLLPAWMQDNVRRGGELVGGQGKAAPKFDFATLYRLREWHNGEFRALPNAPKTLAATERPDSLFHI
ncbi:MAG: LmbE family protein [Verrucomicrobiales bacterium]|nr:LmbE family protein [Verrucomicrobiales bacterium]